jgi:putative copper export protein
MLWAGGLFMVLLVAARPRTDDAAARDRLEHLFHAIVHPGVLLVLATGILLIFHDPAALGTRPLQVKLLLVLGLIVLQVRTFAFLLGRPEGPATVSRQRLWALGGAVGIGFLGVLAVS